MRGEIFTEEDFGTPGELTESYDKLLDERPEYYVFNGSVHGLKAEAPMKAKVGETVRIFFGIGGPNKNVGVPRESASSSTGFIVRFHHRCHDARRGDRQHRGLVAVAEVIFEVPGRYALVDHALSRVERGLAAFLEIEGPANPEEFDHTLRRS